MSHGHDGCTCGHGQEADITLTPVVTEGANLLPQDSDRTRATGGDCCGGGHAHDATDGDCCGGGHAHG